MVYAGDKELGGIRKPAIVEYAQSILYVKNLNGNNDTDKYWKLYRGYKIGAFCALGVGLASMGFGFVCLIGNSFPDVQNPTNTWAAFVFGGLGVSLASIPLFVISHKNGKKAESVNVSLNVASIPAVASCGQMLAQPACGVSINF